MKNKKLFAIVFAASLLSGCHSLLSKIHIIDIQQGNVLTTDQIQKLRPGMSKAAVGELLGDPVLVNLFDKNRWDYVYSLEKPRQPRIEHRLTIYFDHDRLTHFEQSN